MAHSAATMICLGADEIVMGKMSEISPLDPATARWLVPKMVKNGIYSYSVFWRLIWACLVSNSWPC